MANGVEQDEALQEIRYKRGSLELLDQRKLPLQTLYLNIRGSEDGRVVIRNPPPEIKEGGVSDIVRFRGDGMNWELKLMHKA